MAFSNSTNRRFIRAPKKRPPTHSGACLKYHFCFAPIDMKLAKKVYFLIDNLFGEYDFASNVLNVKDGHYVYLYMDQDNLTHIDFNGEDWTPAETDLVFDRIRSVLRSNNIYFAFTNFREVEDKKKNQLTKPATCDKIESSETKGPNNETLSSSSSSRRRPRRKASSGASPQEAD